MNINKRLIIAIVLLLPLLVKWDCSNGIASPGQVFEQKESISDTKKKKEKANDLACYKSGRRVKKSDLLYSASGTVDVSPDYCVNTRHATSTTAIPPADIPGKKDVSASMELGKQDKSIATRTEKEQIGKRARRRSLKAGGKQIWGHITEGASIKAGFLTITLKNIEEQPQLYRYKNAKNNRPIPFEKNRFLPLYVGDKKEIYRWDEKEGKLKPLEIPADHDVRAISRNGKFYMAVSYPEKVKPVRPTTFIHTLYSDSGESVFDIQTKGYSRPTVSDNGEVVLTIGNEMPNTIQFYDNTGQLRNEYSAQIGRRTFSDDGEYFAFISNCFGTCQESPGIEIYFTDKLGNLIWRRNLKRGLHGTAIKISPDNKYIACSIHEINTYDDMLFVFDTNGNQILGEIVFRPSGSGGRDNRFLFDQDSRLLFLAGLTDIYGYNLENGLLIWQKYVNLDTSGVGVKYLDKRIIDAGISIKYQRLFLMAVCRRKSGMVLSTELQIFDFDGNLLSQQRIHRRDTFSKLALNQNEDLLHIYAAEKHFIFALSSRDN